MQHIFLKKENKALYIENQALCDEEAMEEHAHEERK
jgi:hypothetical protein